MTLSEWIECKILRRHPAFYLSPVRVPRKSRARSENVLICLRCGGVA